MSELKFKVGDEVALEGPTGRLSCKKILVSYPGVENSEGKENRVYWLPGPGLGWLELSAETGYYLGSQPQQFIIPWTPEVEERYRVQQLQDQAVQLTAKARETQWHTKLTVEEAQALIQILERVRQR
jgi:hypothetical protein